MANIVKWFPTSVYDETDIIPPDYNDKIYNYVKSLQAEIISGGLDWQGNTYTSHDKHNLTKDSRFDILINEITNHVNVFAKAHNSNAIYRCHTAWFNIGLSDNFQEYHYHAASTFSAVYYIKVPEGSGQLVFENPILDMCPIEKIYDRNDLSYIQVGYSPIERSVIIFRSYLRHMVKAGTFDGERISIACNFEVVR
jgi:uncharacterized protein (TIGR02466 family)